MKLPQTANTNELQQESKTHLKAGKIGISKYFSDRIFLHTHLFLLFPNLLSLQYWQNQRHHMEKFMIEIVSVTGQLPSKVQSLTQCAL